MKKLLFISLALACAFGIVIYSGTFSKEASVANAKTAKYTGTVYVAGMGGHFAVAEVVVDPSDTENPIKVTSLDKIDIGNKKTHPTHDPRIDIKDRTKMYWSTYKIDKELKAKGKDRILHVGVSDLTTGKVLKDMEVAVDDRAAWTGAMYCASGQTKKSFIPVSMSNEAYLDFFDKKTLKLKKRVFLDSLGYKDNYFFYHGINSPDLKTFAMAINLTQDWAKPGSPAARKGLVDMLILDLKALEKGKVKVLAKNTVTGDPKKTLTFRQTFTPDGKKLLQSGGDRFYLLDGKTLELLDEEIMSAGENHDAVPTPDGKYALLTLRTVMQDKRKDGTLQLYDMEAMKVVGKPVSVCIACHADMIPGSAVLCGADINWK